MERDLNRDRIKGLACILMLIAHLRLAPGIADWAYTVTFIGGLSAMLFLAISGLNAAVTAENKSLRELAIVNGLLFLIGVGYGAVVQMTLYANYVFEILQIIAIGSFCVGVTAKYTGYRPVLFGAIAIVIATLHLILQNYAPHFDGFGLIETSNHYAPLGIELPEGGTRYPGFPLLPWLAAFFWGASVYYAKRIFHLVVIVLGLGICFIETPITPFLGNVKEKWDMSIGYMLMSATAYSMAILLCRSLPSSVMHKEKLLVFVGINSFAFLYLHLFAIPLWFLSSSIGPIGLWAVAITFVLLLMYTYSRWAKVKRQYPLVFWLVLIVISLLLPILPAQDVTWHLPLAFVFAFIGLFFVKYFNEIKLQLIQALAK